MENNIGSIDRFIRLIAGVILLILSIASHLTSGLIFYSAMGLGMFLFSTAVLGTCPLYYFLRKSTV